MSPNTGIIQVITTIDSDRAARDIARAAIEQRLAACAQVAGPIASTYWWQGKIDEATEWMCLLKTTLDKYPELERLIKANHSYSVPEILAIPVVAGNVEYLEWLRQNVT